MYTLYIASSVIYFVCFVFFGSRYSAAYSRINRLESLKKNGALKINQIKIKELKKKAKKDKISSLIFYNVILLLDLVILIFSNKSNVVDFIYIFIIYFGFIFFLFLLFWLKGNGTIDSNVRMHGGLRI